MLSVAKLATPAAAATVVVPDNVPLPGLLSVTVTCPVKLVARFPSPSSARTFTAGLKLLPPVIVPGCVPNTSWVAVPAMILNELLVAVPDRKGVGEGTGGALVGW